MLNQQLYGSVYGYGYGGGGGGYSGDYAAQAILAPATIQDMSNLIDKIRVSGASFHLAQIAIHVADIANGTVNGTILTGLQDINYFRQIQGHVPNPQGSLLSWQLLEVDWNKYGAADPNLSDNDVMENFIHDGLTGP